MMKQLYELSGGSSSIIYFSIGEGYAKGYANAI